MKTLKILFSYFYYFFFSGISSSYSPLDGDSVSMSVFDTILEKYL